MGSFTPNGSTSSAERGGRRAAHRLGGVALVVLGFLLLGYAGVDLVAGEPFGGRASRSWLLFAALPVILVGGLLLQLGFGRPAGRGVAAAGEEPQPRGSLADLGFGDGARRHHERNLPGER